jgi:uncharacterized repeat protein (TIGR03837 family)
LAARGHTVHLYVDDASALQWMAPTAFEGVSVLPWPDDAAVFAAKELPQVVIEAFGCQLPLGFQAAMGLAPQPPVWVNLEYFSAEPSALRNHGLPSPVMHGPAKGLTKWFFYPGLSPHSGGVLGPGMDGRVVKGQQTSSGSQHASHTNVHHPHEPMSLQHDKLSLPTKPLRISLFCYEPASLGLWLQQLASLPLVVHLKVTAGRASQAVDAVLQTWTPPANLKIEQLPYLSHPEFDQLLAAQDLNLVRGEDSLVRAIWAGQAFLWQIYPQDDGAHWPKLQAFLTATQAPTVVVQAHLAWNADQPTALPALTPEHWAQWSAWALALRRRLQAETDLLTRLESFVAAHG